MNKKGALFHWLIFGILAALGFFLLLSYQPGLGEPKGSWQLNFLTNYFFAAENDLLKIEQFAKYAAWQTALELGEKGGFNRAGPCGYLEGSPLWNQLTDWGRCLPRLPEEASLLVQEKLKSFLPENNFKITFSGDNLIGRGEKKSLLSSEPSYIKYTYDTSFRVALGYSFDEYEKVKEEAQSLVLKCRPDKNLKKCLEKEKPSNWKFKDCLGEKYQEEERKVPFCVESPNKVYDVEMNLKPVRYKLALDFTPVKPFNIEEFEIHYDETNHFYELTFAPEESAAAYRLYFTDYLYLEGRSGSVNELKTLVWGNFFWAYKEFKKEALLNEPEKCASGILREANQAYLCNEKILFTLSDIRLTPDQEYLFGPTALRGDEESEITSLVKIKYT